MPAAAVPSLLVQARHTCVCIYMIMPCSAPLLQHSPSYTTPPPTTLPSPTTLPPPAAGASMACRPPRVCLGVWTPHHRCCGRRPAHAPLTPPFSHTPSHSALALLYLLRPSYTALLGPPTPSGPRPLYQVMTRPPQLRQQFEAVLKWSPSLHHWWGRASPREVVDLRDYSHLDSHPNSHPRKEHRRSMPCGGTLHMRTGWQVKR